MGDRTAAVQFYNTAVASINQHDNPARLQHSIQMFTSAAYADPTFGQAFYQIGNNASDMNQLEIAVASYRRALECENTNEEQAKILCNLGWRLHSLGHEEEALQCTLGSLLLDPKLAYAHTNLSLIYGTLDKPGRSVSEAKRAFELAPDDSTVEMALAFALLYDGRFAEGFKHFEARFAYRLKNFLSYPYPKWNGEEGKTVYLVADQGLGDTLSFARFVEAAAKRAKYIHACVQPELMRLFLHAFMHLPNVNIIPSPSPFPQADAWTTFVSLPYALGLSDQEIRDAKNIELPVYSLPKTWKVPDRKLHIGIAWRGSAMNDINEHRSIPVTQFLDLYRVPGIQLYSLQVDASKNQMHEQGCAPLIRDLSGFISDVTDTVSLLRDLDMVISVESALAHIRAASGKECWVPYSFLGRDYRIGLDGKDRLWSPKHRIFRQGQYEPWSKVFERIVEALREKVNAIPA